MAKARTESITDEVEAKFWLSLFDDLKKAVLANTIAVPESEFHKTESMFDKRLEEAIIDVIDELSMGLKLHSWEDIFEEQIKEAAKIFIGEKTKEKEWWTIAFESDPHADIKSRTSIHARMILPQVVADYNRQNKQQFLQMEKEELEKYAEKPLSWDELLLESKKSTLDAMLGNNAKQHRPLRLEILLHELRRIGLDDKALQEFAFSKELLDAPYVNIHSSIWAAVAEAYRQGREPQSGDFYDAPILSSVLPYCDIIATEKFMKDLLIYKLPSYKEYDTIIYSASNTDKLTFQKQVRELIGAH